MTMGAETVFIDTNILVYATDNESPFNAKSLGIIKQLMTDGIVFAISPQIVREYLILDKVSIDTIINAKTIE